MDKQDRRAAVVGVATAKMQKDMPMTVRDVAHRLIREAIEDAGIHEVPRLEKNLVVLATIAHISPLLGLLGTVVGMIRAFMTIEEMEGVVNPSHLAGGIWEALLTTAFGLLVAILAYVAYNFLVARVGKIVLDMETSATEVVNLLSEEE